MYRLLLSLSMCLPTILLAQGGNINFQQFQTSADPSPLAQAEARHLNLNFALLHNVEPDALVAVFNVVQLGETVAEINQLLKLRLDALQSALAELGIKESDMFVDMVSQVPLYTYETERKLFSKNFVEVPSGFELQKNLHIRFEDPSLIDQIVAAAGAQEIHDLAKVDYFVDNTHEIYQNLREEAAKLFKARKALYMQLDLDLDSIFHTVAETRQAYLPMSRYTGYQAVMQYGYGQSEKNVTKARKPKAQYYNPISYAGYDKVINPEIIGPVVQFSYQLLVRYTQDDPYRTPVLMLNPEEGRLQGLMLPRKD